MIDLPSLSFSMSCHTCWRTLGSRPVVGSSSRIILGFPTAAMARLSLRFMPPLKLPTFCFFSGSRLTNYSISSILSATYSWGTPLSLANMQRCCSAVSSLQRMSNWEHTPMCFLISSISDIGLLSMMIQDPCTSSGLITPVRMFISVVLPAPLWPKIPINSLASISKVKFFKASTLWFEKRLPKVLHRFLMRSPKAGIPFLELWNTFSLSLHADSSSYRKAQGEYSCSSGSYSRCRSSLWLRLLNRNRNSLLRGKYRGSLRPRLAEMTWSKQQVRSMKKRQSPNSTPIDLRSEYLQQFPPPKGSMLSMSSENLPQEQEISAGTHFLQVKLKWKPEY